MPESSGSSSTTPVRGALGLSVAMGMGRFFYTPALPLMVAALHWSSAPGAWIATLNYVGYFIGTLVITQGPVRPNRFVYRLSLIVSTLGLAAVNLSPDLLWQGSIRTIAGIASGLIFVCVTQRSPTNSRRPSDGGISYGGLGFGVLVSGAIVLAAGSFADWRQLWLICAGISAVFSVIAWTWPIPTRTPASTSPVARPPRPNPDIDEAGSPAEVDPPFDANRRRAMAIVSTGYFFQGGGVVFSECFGFSPFDVQNVRRSRAFPPKRTWQGWTVAHISVIRISTVVRLQTSSRQTTRNSAQNWYSAIPPFTPCSPESSTAAPHRHSIRLIRTIKPVRLSWSTLRVQPPP